LDRYPVVQSCLCDRKVDRQLGRQSRRRLVNPSDAVRLTLMLIVHQEFLMSLHLLQQDRMHHFARYLLVRLGTALFSSSSSRLASCGLIESRRTVTVTVLPITPAFVTIPSSTVMMC
jgi:hypothetical protein